MFTAPSHPAWLAVVMLAVTPMVPNTDRLMLSVCGADGVNRTVSVPIDRDPERPEDCAQACHAVCSRKPADGDRPEEEV